MDWNIFEAKRGSTEITHTLVHNLKDFEEVMLESYKKHRDDPDAYLKVTTTMPRHLGNIFIDDEAAFCTIFLHYSKEFSYEDFIGKDGKFIKRDDFGTFIHDRETWAEFREYAKRRQARKYKAWYEKKKKEKLDGKICNNA